MVGKVERKSAIKLLNWQQEIFQRLRNWAPSLSTFNGLNKTKHFNKLMRNDNKDKNIF